MNDPIVGLPKMAVLCLCPRTKAVLGGSNRSENKRQKCLCRLYDPMSGFTVDTRATLVLWHARQFLCMAAELTSLGQQHRAAQDFYFPSI
jgi:hypothetical protein